MLRGFLIIQSLMAGFLLGYVALDWQNHCAFHQTELLGSLAAGPSRLLGSEELSCMAPWILIYVALLKLSYMAPWLMGLLDC